MFRIGRTVSPWPVACFRSTRKQLRPSERFCTSASGVVRVSRIIMSLCWTREIQTFCPLTTQRPSFFTAMVLSRVVSLPVVGSVQSQTAGGVAIGSVVIADLELQGGVRVERMRLTALPGLGTPLLGMDVLGRLRWQQDAGRLRVESAGPLR